MTPFDAPGTAFRVGDVIVMPDSRLIIDAQGKQDVVDPKPLAVLLELMRAQGRPVSRSALFDAVWGDAVVVEEALTRCISELRKVLGDSAQDQRVIRTVRGRGYVLLQPVSELGKLDGETAEYAVPVMREQGRRWRAMMIAALLMVTFIPLGYLLAQSRGGQDVPLVYRPVTFNDGIERSPDLTDDGVWLAFVQLTEDGRGSLGVSDLETGQSVELDWLDGQLAGTVERALWVTDGIELILMVGDSGGCRLVSVHLSRRSTQTLGSCEGSYHRDADVSPDGRWVAFSRLKDGKLPMELVLLDLDTGAESTLLASSGAHYGDHHPVFSPDGSKLAFVRSEAESDADLFTLDLGSKQIQRITDQHGVIAGLAWEDPSMLVYGAARYGPAKLWRVDVSTKTRKPEWVPTGTDEAAFPTVARETGKLAFVQNHSVTDLVVWEQGAESILVSNGAMNSAPALSPDGKRLAWVSDVSGSREIWLMELDSGLRRQLTHDRSWADAPSWSPDGAYLAYTLTVDGYHAVWVHSLSDGVSAPLTSGPADHIMPTWHPDGEQVFSASNASGSWDMWLHQVKGGAASRVTDGSERVRVQSVRLQGTVEPTMVFASPERAGLWVQGPMSEGKDHRSVEMMELDWGGWALAGDSVFYLVRSERGISLRVESLLAAGSGGREVAVLDAIRRWSIPWFGPALTVDVTGKMVVFPRVAVRSGDIWAADLDGAH